MAFVCGVRRFIVGVNMMDMFPDPQVAKDRFNEVS
jgi:hypothetical protein